jgi:hypothetical protein
MRGLFVGFAGFAFLTRLSPVSCSVSARNDVP